MSNEINEVIGPRAIDGRNVGVVDKQIPVNIGVGSVIFEIFLWVVGVIPSIVLIAYGKVDFIYGVGLSLLGTLPGWVFLFMKINALSNLRKQEQKIQADASEIDNFLEQRVIILTNVAGLLKKSIDLDIGVMTSVAAYRGGLSPEDDHIRNAAARQIDKAFVWINAATENYPNLKSQEALVSAMRQNSYLQKEITAARTLYNDSVFAWNREIFSWPTYQIVAARAGFTTRIPYSASEEVKESARKIFF